MDYKEKYIAALERAKKLQETCDSQAVVGWCEYIFPELKEREDERIKFLIKSCVYAYDITLEVREEIFAWLEKQGHMLDPDKVIEWLKHRELSCDDVVTTMIPDDSPTSVRHKVKWLSDEFIKQFKKDFGL